MEDLSFAKMDPAAKAAITAGVRKFAGLATDAILDPVTYVFKDPKVEGFIPYRRAGKVFVVFGDPVCSVEDKLFLAKAFLEFAREERKEVIYVIASHLFAHTLVKNVGGSFMELASEMIFDPICDPREEVGALGSLVRRKVKQAQKELTIEEYIGDDPLLEKAIENIGDRWLEKRKGPQVHISNIYLFENRIGKRWFYAIKGKEVVGVILLNELQSHKGYLLNHLMVTPEAPHGTAEYLVVAALEVLSKEGCRFATVGAVPRSEIGEVLGLHPFSKWFVKLGLWIVRKVSPIEGLFTFWKKFHPQSQPCYLILSRTKLGVKEVLGLKRAFTVGPTK
jgi:lysylphosphatidylglycerol synthetase-like protein (DUF2156 family)